MTNLQDSVCQYLKAHGAADVQTLGRHLLDTTTYYPSVASAASAATIVVGHLRRIGKVTRADASARTWTLIDR